MHRFKRYRLPESIIRPLNDDSLVQEDGNKAPCYPANTVIARSAHNGTLATHSFRTHEPTEFQRKGVNLVNKFEREPPPPCSLSRFFFLLNNSCVIFFWIFCKEIEYFFKYTKRFKNMKNYNKF